VYGYNKWVAGLSALFFGSEIGTTFYQPVSDLDNISLQVFKAAKYLAGFADSLILIAEGYVAPPIIYPLGTVNEDFRIYWHAKNSFDNHPTHWELVELSNPSVIEDDLESGTGRWVLQGFTHSTARPHSGSYSFFSGSTNNMNNAVRTAHPYLVQAGDSLTFWYWHDLETNYDVAIVEVSENTKEWFCADTMRYSGSSSGWRRRALSLASWVGTSIYIRFRAMTDGSALDVGFYVDDISPVCLFANVDTISSSIPDTSYLFTGHAQGVFYYYVRGSNTTYGWGDYSCLERANIVVGVIEEHSVDPVKPSFSLSPNPFRHKTNIKFQIPNAKCQIRIYDVTGGLVKSFISSTPHARRPTHIIWDGTDHVDRRVPAGIYFVHFEVGDFRKIEKAILLR
jgi:hypothetical protein